METPYLDLDSWELRNDSGVIGGYACYVDPVTREMRSFRGKDVEEAERKARMDFWRRHPEMVPVREEHET
jgi:hypothetical protein